MKCNRCNNETYMPFRCPYCEQYFCVEHRLPENHMCSEYWRVKKPKELPTRTRRQPDPDSPYQHTVTIRSPQKRRKLIRFSSTEVKHLLIGALLTLAIGFSMPLYGASWLYGHLEVLTGLAIIFTFSFIAHELAHKITAQQHGLWAEFRITLYGALITLLSIISPFKIISPGAVMVGGAADRETIGKTSISGPLVNIALALIFLILAQFSPFPTSTIMGFGTMINSFIALFNLIPFGVLDGFKVFFWNKAIWAAFFAMSLTLTIYSYLGFQLFL